LSEGLPEQTLGPVPLNGVADSLAGDHAKLGACSRFSGSIIEEERVFAIYLLAVAIDLSKLPGFAQNVQRHDSVFRQRESLSGIRLKAWAPFKLRRELLTASFAAPFQNEAAGSRAHPLAKAVRPRPTLILRLESSFHWNFALADRSGGSAALEMTLISKESRKVPRDFFLKESKVAEEEMEVKTIVPGAVRPNPVYGTYCDIVHPNPFASAPSSCVLEICLSVARRRGSLTYPESTRVIHRAHTYNSQQKDTLPIVVNNSILPLKAGLDFC
jgi:hypothetical protein